MKTNCEKCGSSDGVEVYEDHEFCYVCNAYNPNAERVIMNEPTTNPEFTSFTDIGTYNSYPISSRSISLEIVNHFNVKMSVDSNGAPASHYYPYTKGGQTVAYKERILPKDFRVHGDIKGTELFGQSRCTGSRTLVITEGELDCLSVAQAFKSYKTGTIFPCVSLPSASGTTSVLLNRDWVNQFETVILMFDQDEAGRKATDTVAKMIKAGKCRVAKLPEKDPNDTLVKHGGKAILQAIWDAQPWSPAGIVMGEQVWEQFQASVKQLNLSRSLHALTGLTLN